METTSFSSDTPDISAKPVEILPGDSFMLEAARFQPQPQMCFAGKVGAVLLSVYSGVPFQPEYEERI